MNKRATNVKPDGLKKPDRYAWLSSLQCNQVYVSRNGEHATNYITAAQWIEEYGTNDLSGMDAAEVQKMKDTNTIWQVQIYPNTPIGFVVFYGATLDAAIDAAMAELGTRCHDD